MREEDQRLVTEPAPPQSLLALLATLDPIDEDFPPIRDPHPELPRENWLRGPDVQLKLDRRGRSA